VYPCYCNNSKQNSPTDTGQTLWQILDHVFFTVLQDKKKNTCIKLSDGNTASTVIVFSIKYLLPAMPYLLSLCLEQCQIPMQSNQTFAA
jgi:hypothetical protein